MTRRAALLRSARSDLTQSSYHARLLAAATWQDADLCLRIIADKGHMTAELVAAAWGHLHTTLLPATDMQDPGVRQLLHKFLYRLRHLTLQHGDSMPAAGLAATLRALAVWRSAKLPLREVLWGRLLQVSLGPQRVLCAMWWLVGSTATTVPVSSRGDAAHGRLLCRPSQGQPSEF